MAILDFNGAPIDKLQYVNQDDIPAAQNRIYNNPLGDDGGVSPKQGSFYDPSQMFADSGIIPNKPGENSGTAIPGMDEVAPTGSSKLFLILGVVALAAIIFGVIKVK